MLIKELIELLKKENPEAEIKVYFDDKIKYLMAIGGNSFLTKEVCIITENHHGNR